MTDHANCQPEAWAAAARVTRELRESMERLERERDQLKEINDRMAEDRLRIIDQRDQFRNMMNSTVSAGVIIDGERLDTLREVERLQAIVEAVKALHRPDDEAFLARQGWAYCLTCVDESHPCETRRAVDQASAFQ